MRLEGIGIYPRHLRRRQSLPTGSAEAGVNEPANGFTRPKDPRSRGDRHLIRVPSTARLPHRPTDSAGTRLTADLPTGTRDAVVGGKVLDSRPDQMAGTPAECRACGQSYGERTIFRIYV